MCYGEAYQIYCIHPPLGGNSGYVIEDGWDHNITPDDDITTEQSVPISSTVTGLQINI